MVKTAISHTQQREPKTHTLTSTEVITASEFTGGR